MSIKVFQSFVFSSILLSAIFAVKSLKCYKCSSMQNRLCASNPLQTVVCPNDSTGCMKMTLESLDYDNRIIFDKEQIRKADFDFDALEPFFTPEYVFIVLRKCKDNYTFLVDPSTCKDIPDYKYNISACMCESDLCNNISRQNLTTLLVILNLSFLLYLT